MADMNLAVIPYAWQFGYYGGVPVYVFTDTTVERTAGQPSLRIQKGGAIDPWGIFDRAAWTNMPQFGFSVKPGDHIVARAWMKTDPSSKNNTTAGARIGVDLYGGGHQLDGYPGTHITDGSEWVHWGTSGWMMREYDFIVPTTIYTKDALGNTISPTQISAIEMWCQAYPGDDNGNIWIADAELYINPTAAPPVQPPAPQGNNAAVAIALGLLGIGVIAYLAVGRR